MATDKQSTGRDQSRQQTSEMAHGAAQQGSNPAGQGAGSQANAWQDPSTSGQGQSAMQTRRGSSLPSSYFGGFGGGPFSMLRRINEDMERLFENFGFGRSLFPSEAGFGNWPAVGGESASSLWSPRVEVFERDGKLVISADLPGVKKEDVNVQIDRDAVTIQGERKQEQTTSERGYYRSERSYGSFYRTIPLPEGADAQTASATFRDGVLQIEIKAPQQRPTSRTLEINDASSSGTTSAGTTSRSTAGESQQMSGGDKQQQR
jgi:HSP20 family protein